MLSLRYDDRRFSRLLRIDGPTCAITRGIGRLRPLLRILKTVCLVGGLASLSAPLLSAAPQQNEVRVPVSRTFAVSYVVHVAPAAASHKIQICAPIPSSDSVQTISSLHFGGAGKPRIL